MYKAAVIGLGNIGLLYDLDPKRVHPSTHVVAFEHSSKFDLVCGVDGDLKKKGILNELSPSARFYSSLDHALTSGILDDVDVISICTPPRTHLDILLKLIDTHVGKVIFCEKPLVNDVAEADILMEKLKSCDVVVVPNISRRWNSGLRKVKADIEAYCFGQLKKINIRYTRGIYNTGSHLFDLLKMWTDSNVRSVFSLGETKTSAYPEKTFSFRFELSNGATGYAEAIDDRDYYLFDIDLYFSEGKIEVKNSGDDIIYYKKAPHHLFSDFNELQMVYSCTNQLSDACIKNAIDNISNVLDHKELPYCVIEDAIYPIKVAEALEESFKNKTEIEI